MSNSLEPDQDRHFVGPDLGPSCLQKLSTDDKKWRLARKEFTRVNSPIIFLTIINAF